MKTWQVIVGDGYQLCKIWRKDEASEVLVTSFRSRIANVNRGAAGRGRSSIQGFSSPVSKVLYVPRGEDVRPEDVVWSAGRRYRVVAVDEFAHGNQALLRLVQ